MALQKVLSFSGGQTSGYMLRREIERIGIDRYREEFITIFCNTGKEHDSTLDFVHEVETRWKVPIVWLEYTRIPAIDINPELVPRGRKEANLRKAQAQGLSAHWFKEVNYFTAARDSDEHGPFDEMLEWAAAMPNVRGRSCSAFLKIRNIAKYLHSLGIHEWEDYIGIRYDEAHRALEITANRDDKGRFAKFPLIDSQTTKAHVDYWWNQHPFRLNIANHEGNCRGCFLKAKWKRLLWAKENPKSAQWWSDWEKKKRASGMSGDGATFQKGKTYEALIHEANQPTLFDVDMTEEDVPCSCAVGGYRGSNTEENEP